MKLKKYKCLALDHDDTAVRTTPDIHYPSFVETLKLLRPGRPAPTLEEFIADNCHKGFAEMCDELEFTPEEMEIEGKMWRRWTNGIIPHAYPGMEKLIADFRAAGGKVCVISHSEKDIIRRDYRARFGGEPDMVFGWELPREKRKPDPYALDASMEAWGLEKGQVLVVDDMRLGLEMARRRGVDFGWAGWSETAPVVGEYMRKNADYSFESPEELRKFLLE